MSERHPGGSWLRCSLTRFPTSERVADLNFLSGVGYHLSADSVLVPIGSDHEAGAPTPNHEQEVEKRVDAVIDDLSNGRVVPRKVDQLADAVTRSRVDAQVGRAINRSFTR